MSEALGKIKVSPTVHTAADNCSRLPVGYVLRTNADAARYVLNTCSYSVRESQQMDGYLLELFLGGRISANWINVLPYHKCVH